MMISLGRKPQTSMIPDIQLLQYCILQRNSLVQISSMVGKKMNSTDENGQVKVNRLCNFGTVDLRLYQEAGSACSILAFIFVTFRAYDSLLLIPTLVLATKKKGNKLSHDSMPALKLPHKNMVWLFLSLGAYNLMI